MPVLKSFHALSRTHWRTGAICGLMCGLTARSLVARIGVVTLDVEPSSKSEKVKNLMDLSAYPHASRRMPVFADHGVVATSQPLAAQAGLRMLQQGGNAVDAALATAIALTVVEPTSNGIGSDTFALVWDGESLSGLNGSGRSAQALSAEALRDQGHTAMPEFGWPAVTVPGAPAAWEALHERYAKLPLEVIMAPAIGYARDGFGVTPTIADKWGEAANNYLHNQDPALAQWGVTFTNKGKTPAVGERWQCLQQVKGLETLLAKGLRDFYTGEIAERIVNYAQQTGGLISGQDLAAHSSQWVEPISASYGEYEVWEIPPNGQGIAALMALRIMREVDAGRHPRLSADSWHVQIEAMKLAFADVYRVVADPEHVTVPVATMLSDAYLQSRAQLLGDRAMLPAAGLDNHSDTVYLCTADRDGMMVSLIQSNYQGFGSGVVIPEVGISMQNRGACFSLEAGHLNEAAGGKRPRHTIIPGFLTRQGRPMGPFGVMGGEMQPQGHLQVVSAMVDYDLNPQAALDAPRWQVTGGLGVSIESEVPADVIEELSRRGHQITVVTDRTGFGRGQIIRRLDNGIYVAGSEPRADGAAVGW